MKKILLTTGVLLALTASVASAAGINLYWTDCSAGAAATTNKDFACASNSGANTMTASFDPPAGVDQLNGNNLILDLQTSGAGLSPWWDMFGPNTGSCRNSLSANTVFSLFTCEDPWGGGTPGITAYIRGANGPNTARIGGSVSVVSPVAVNPGSEYYSLNIVINNQRTTGTPVCDGCLEAACIVLNEVKLTQPAGSPGGSPVLNNPLTSNYVTWQGGQISAPGCPAATPTVNKTWGQVKSIYR